MSGDVPPPYQPPQSPYGAPMAQAMQPSDERLWMTLVDVGGIFFSFAPSLIAYLVLKDRSDFMRRNSQSALNFQITMGIIQVANFIVGLILAVVTFGIWGFVEFLIWLAVAVVVLIFSIVAAIAANKGADYRYPLSIPLIK